MNEQTIELGGRAYAIPTDRSIANDLFIEAEAARAGLGELRMEDGESPDEFARRILRTAMQSGSLLRLLGGLLIPATLDVSDWTEETADVTAKHLASITAPADKDAIRAILAATLARFFLSAVACATISPASSAAAQHVQEPSRGVSSTTAGADLAAIVPSGEA